MLLLVSMTLTLIQGHSGSANAKISVECSRANKQAIIISIKLAKTVRPVLRDLDFANVYMA